VLKNGLFNRKSLKCCVRKHKYFQETLISAISSTTESLLLPYIDELSMMEVVEESNICETLLKIAWFEVIVHPYIS